MERAEFEQWKPKEVARLLALVETERRYYQEIVANLPVGLVIVNAELNVVSANRLFRSRTGLKNDEILGKPLGQVVAAEAVLKLARETVDTNQSSAPVFVEWAGSRARVTGLPLRGWEEDSLSEALLLIEEQGAALPAALSRVLWQADMSAEALEALSRHAGEPEQGKLREFYQSLAGAAETQLEIAYRNAEGVACRDVVWLERNAAGEVVSLTGLTLGAEGQRAQLQQEVAAAQAESLQRLSAKLAHDLNNLLMIISGYGEELKNAVPTEHPLHQDMQEILSAAGRLYGLTNQFHAYSRRPVVSPAAHAVGGWIEGLLAKLREAGLEMALRGQIGETIAARFDEGQLTELFVAAGRLGVLAGSQKAELTFEAGREQHQIELKLGNAEFPANWLEPWFALNDEQREAQLALAAAYHALREAGGALRLEGGRLTVTVPAALLQPAPVELAAPPPVEAAPVEAAPSLEAILVVEDEAGIRALVRKILSRQGYEVLEAASGQDALTVLGSAARVDLLLTDVMMPGMNGVELSRQALAAHPHLKVLFVSGYTDERVLEAGEFPAGTAFLQKPFTLGGLLGKVREVLDSGAARQAAS
jgi:CheY-like chemotaxis protein